MYVTPYAGVWIEISIKMSADPTNKVTPYAGVWIEIFSGSFDKCAYTVTPYAGVWIEIRNSFLTYQQGICHSLRGSVD